MRASNDLHKLVFCPARGGPVGLKRARFDAHRPQFIIYDQSGVGVGRAQETNGLALTPSASTRTDEADPSQF